MARYDERMMGTSGARGSTAISDLQDGHILPRPCVLIGMNRSPFPPSTTSLLAVIRGIEQQIVNMPRGPARAWKSPLSTCDYGIEGSIPCGQLSCMEGRRSVC